MDRSVAIMAKAADMPIKVSRERRRFRSRLRSAILP